MLTIICMFLMVCGAIVTLSLVAAFGPVVLVVVGFVTLDYLVLKLIFRKNKKKGE